jgi:hypothetical protein
MEARFIPVDDVLLERISLPRPVAGAMKSRLARPRWDEEYVYRIAVAGKEAQGKLIEAGGQKACNDAVNQSLTPSLPGWQSILATKELAKSRSA